jgi:hypothetical protein
MLIMDVDQESLSRVLIKDDEEGVRMLIKNVFKDVDQKC